MNYSRTQIDAICFFLLSVESTKTEKVSLEKIFENGHHQPLFDAGLTIKDIDSFNVWLKNRGYQSIKWGADLSSYKSSLQYYESIRKSIDRKFNDYSIEIDTLRMKYQPSFDKYQAYFITMSGVEMWVKCENGEDLVEAMKKYNINSSYDRFLRTFSY